MRSTHRPLAGLLLALCLAAAPARGEELNVYSARHYDSDEALYAAFTQASGIEVNVLQGDSDQLIERIRREGRASPADVLVTVDAGRLLRAEQAGVLAPLRSEVLTTRIPEHLRHPDGLWFGFSQRLRLIYFDAERIDPDTLTSYEDLADPRFRGEVCIRSSSNVYNQSLLASMIAHHGADAAEQWARGLVANFARPPQGGDTDQIMGVAAGECGIGVANHYYYLRLLESEDPADRAAAERVQVLIPNQQGRGAHVNVGGAGLIREAPHPAQAREFLEFLASDEAQSLFASGNHEFPVVDGADTHPSLARWNDERLDTLDVHLLGRNNAQAVRIADRAGWR